MTRYKIAAYIIDLIGALFIAFYGVGQRMSAEEGSFWSTTNTEPFLYPGLVLMVIGTAMLFYGVKKTRNAQASKQAEDKS